MKIKYQLLLKNCYCSMFLISDGGKVWQLCSVNFFALHCFYFDYLLKFSEFKHFLIFCRKVVARAAYESGEFSVTMSMYYDEPRTTPLSPNAEIEVLDFIYVTIQPDADLDDSQFYVQVRVGLKAMALFCMRVAILVRGKKKQYKGKWLGAPHSKILKIQQVERLHDKVVARLIAEQGCVLRLQKQEFSTDCTAVLFKLIKKSEAFFK